MAIEHRRVSAWINAFLDVENRNPHRAVKAALNAAWKSINGQRLDGNCDENVAVAEHYLYARWLISEYSIAMLPIVEAGHLHYSLLKEMGVPVPTEGECAVSRVSIEDFQWTARGASDGSADWLGMSRLGHLGAPREPSPGLPVTR
jgi:hypothetical protein